MGSSRYLDLVNDKVVVYDGAFGTYVQTLDLSADDFGGETFEGCNELLVATRPDVIAGMHDAFFQVGVDVVETASFGSFAAGAAVPLLPWFFSDGNAATAASLLLALLATFTCLPVTAHAGPAFGVMGGVVGARLHGDYGDAFGDEYRAGGAFGARARFGVAINLELLVDDQQQDAGAHHHDEAAARPRIDLVEHDPHDRIAEAPAQPHDREQSEGRERRAAGGGHERRSG